MEESSLVAPSGDALPLARIETCPQDVCDIVVAFLGTRDRLRLSATSFTMWNSTLQSCDSLESSSCGSTLVCYNDLVPFGSGETVHKHMAAIQREAAYRGPAQRSVGQRGRGGTQRVLLMTPTSTRQLCQVCAVSFVCEFCATREAMCEDGFGTHVGRWVCPPCLKKHPEQKIFYCEAFSSSPGRGLKLCRDCHLMRHELAGPRYPLCPGAEGVRRARENPSRRDRGRDPGRGGGEEAELAARMAAL